MHEHGGSELFIERLLPEASKNGLAGLLEFTSTLFYLSQGSALLMKKKCGGFRRNRCGTASKAKRKCGTSVFRTFISLSLNFKACF